MPVSSVEIKRHMAPDDIALVSELLDATSHADGQQALSDHLWLDLVHGGRHGFAGLVVRDGDGARPIAYAQVSRGNDAWAIELVVDPEHRDRLAAVGAELLSAALGVIADEGGGTVNWWVSRATDVHARLAASVGLVPRRLLHQMRRALPTGIPFDLTTRPFVVGKDEAAWLEVNNAAFSWHPEQGGWTLETIEAREAEAWFDPSGFLLHERNGRLAGFCWTKIHTDYDPALGEIYVIAVHPDFHGLGLGRSLTLTGLDHLAGEGVTVGMLYVDAENTAALHLYEELGFAIDHSDQAFVGDVVP
jgi:mycothiol synthase